MKTLVNQNNPALRITAPEIIEEEEYYTWDGEKAFLKENWTLVDGIKGNLEEIPSNVDLEKEIDNYIDGYFSECQDGTLLNDGGSELQYEDVSKIARHFYELGLNARKEK